MTATSHNRGHEIKTDTGEWNPEDVKDRKCAHCGMQASPDGYDSCIVEYIDELNRLGGITTIHSCCGHGSGRLARVWCLFTGLKSVNSVLKWINEMDGEKIELERYHGKNARREMMQLIVYINKGARNK